MENQSHALSCFLSKVCTLTAGSDFWPLLKGKTERMLPWCRTFLGLRNPSSVCLLGTNTLNWLLNQASWRSGHPLWWSLDSKPWNYTTNLKRIFSEVLKCFWLVTEMLFFSVCLCIFIHLWHFLISKRERDFREKGKALEWEKVGTYYFLFLSTLQLPNMLYWSLH